MLKKQLFMGIQGTKKCNLLICCFFSFFSLFKPSIVHNIFIV